MSLAKLPVTVIVPVKNEEVNLARCLSRLERFSEVVVVDSSSTDSTAQIAIEHGARLINFEWDGRFPKKRNWVLLNHTLKNEWVLFLDADELVDNRFCDAVDAAIGQEKFVGYWLNYCNWFLGRQLRHGVPQRKLALFKIGVGLYEQIDEDRWSHLDMEVHEHPVLEGPVGEVLVPIEHNDDRGLSKFIDRHQAYALWEARRLALVRRHPTSWNKLTVRQRLKYRYVVHWWFPWFYFLFQYFVKLGVLDGRAGFHYAFYKLWYFYTMRLLARAELE